MADHIPAAVDLRQIEDIADVVGRTHANSSLPRAIAATPASIVSSFLPKHKRTRCRGGSRSAKAEKGTTATPAFSTAAAANVASSTLSPDAARSTQRK